MTEQTSTFTSKIETVCAKHHEKYQQYCKNHDSPCCIKCTKEHHHECKIENLDGIVQNVKESSYIIEIQ